MKIDRFEDLEVWKESRILSKMVFDITSQTPFKSDFKFRDQIKASSGSVMDNIAEGFERGGNKEFIQFLCIAKGSCGETRSQTYRALDFDYIDQPTYESLLNQAILVSRQLSGLISYLKNSGLKGRKYKE
ncbi:MAG: four helix bundle protein [Salinivirgaceae bacterium]|jgi:four helix bundle protein|nr:four helix bundle protein [Salinivirgaceae bacterium]